MCKKSIFPNIISCCKSMHRLTMVFLTFKTYIYRPLPNCRLVDMADHTLYILLYNFLVWLVPWYCTLYNGLQVIKRLSSKYWYINNETWKHKVLIEPKYFQHTCKFTLKLLHINKGQYSLKNSESVGLLLKKLIYCFS